MKVDSEDPALLRVASAIADGTPIDWELECVSSQHLKSKMGRLRLIETFAKAHRAPLSAESLEVPPPGSLEVTAPPTIPAAALHASPSAPRQWGNLRILEKLGQGGFGEVYRAYDPALRREVALKVRRTDPTGGQQTDEAFLEEGRRLARVRHPNVLVVHGADRHGGCVGLWTDLVEGKTLEKCLSEQGPFSADEAALIGVDLCRALAAVHGAGLVHRDVKTSNVMREKGGRIVLMDFGAVSEVSAGGGNGARDAAGTPVTMAPEILLRGESPRPTSDIYSTGVLLYRLVSGSFPVQGRDLADLIESHRSGLTIPLRDLRPDLPASFVRVVERALSADPGQRYGSAGLMERDLVALVAPPAPPPPRPERARVYARVAAMLLLVVAAAGLWWMLTRPLEVHAAFYRESVGTPERVINNSGVGPDDRLFLELRSSHSVHVYVLNEDEQGITYVLFPAGTDMTNPLPGGMLHRLPGSIAGEPQGWTVTNPGVRETILVVASRSALPDLEREIEKLPVAEPGRKIVSHPLEPRALDRLARGIGGMSGPLSARQGGRLAEIGRALDRRRKSGVHQLWFEMIQLENRNP